MVTVQGDRDRYAHHYARIEALAAPLLAAGQPGPLAVTPPGDGFTLHHLLTLQQQQEDRGYKNGVNKPTAYQDSFLQPLFREITRLRRFVEGSADEIWARIVHVAGLLPDAAAPAAQGQQAPPPPLAPATPLSPQALSDIEAHLEEVGQCVVAMERLIRSNARGLAALAEAFDGGARGPEAVEAVLAVKEGGGSEGGMSQGPRISYVTFMEAAVRGGADSGLLFAALSDLYCRRAAARAAAPNINGAAGVAGSSSDPALKPRAATGMSTASSGVWVPPDVFHRSTTKFWVRNEDVPEVIRRVLPHMPLLVFGTEQGSTVLPPRITPSEQQRLLHDPPYPRGPDFPASRVSSVYFDNPETLATYHARLWRTDMATVARVRWYGDRPSAPEAPLFVERKVHREAWTGEKSFKDRAQMAQKGMTAFLQGAELPETTSPFPSAAAAAARKAKLLRDVQAFVVEGEQAPSLRTEYRRLAFQDAGHNKVRVSIDLGLRFVREAGAPRRAGDWCRDTRQPVVRGEAVMFPYAVLEVKLQEAAPPWVIDLVSSGLLVISPKFSKFLHGTAMLFGNRVQQLPHWFQPIASAGAAHGPDNPAAAIGPPGHSLIPIEILREAFGVEDAIFAVTGDLADSPWSSERGSGDRGRSASRGDRDLTPIPTQGLARGAEPPAMPGRAGALVATVPVAAGAEDGPGAVSRVRSVLWKGLGKVVGRGSRSRDRGVRGERVDPDPEAGGMSPAGESGEIVAAVAVPAQDIGGSCPASLAPEGVRGSVAMSNSQGIGPPTPGPHPRSVTALEIRSSGDNGGGLGSNGKSAAARGVPAKRTSSYMTPEISSAENTIMGVASHPPHHLAISMPGSGPGDTGFTTQSTPEPLKSLSKAAAQPAPASIDIEAGALSGAGESRGRAVSNILQRMADACLTAETEAESPGLAYSAAQDPRGQTSVASGAGPESDARPAADGTGILPPPAAPRRGFSRALVSILGRGGEGNEPGAEAGFSPGKASAMKGVSRDSVLGTGAHRGGGGSVGGGGSGSAWGLRGRGESKGAAGEGGLPTVLVRSRVEPKTFFANERTFLQWLNISVLIMFTGLSLLNGGNVSGSTSSAGAAGSAPEGSSGSNSTSGGGGGSWVSCSQASNPSTCYATRISGAIIAPVALLFMGYALFKYRERNRMILRREAVRYDDQRGPVLLVVILGVTLVTAYALAAAFAF